MRIQHNIMAMNAYRNLSVNNSGLSKNLEKLASGYRINRAGDDAAGLAISEKMRAQISGLDQAQKNAQSGINLVQTAEGALTEVHDMLNRMTTLATQAANGTYEAKDRDKLQAEVNALIDEIDRIADNSNFNGTKLLNGDLAEEITSSKSLYTGGSTMVAQSAITVNVPAENSTVQTKFEIALDNIGVDFVSAPGDAVSLVVGGATGATIAIAAASITDDLTSEEMAKLFADTAQVSINGVSYNVTAEGSKLVFTMDEASAAALTAGQAASFSGNFDVSITCAADAASAKLTGTLTLATTPREEGAVNKGEELAQAVASAAITQGQITDGQTFKVGDDVFVLALTKESAAKEYASDNVHVVDLTDLVEENDTTGALQLKQKQDGGAESFSKALTKLTSAMNDNNDMFNVGLDSGKKLVFTQKLSYDGDVDLTKKKEIEKQFSMGGTISEQTDILSGDGGQTLTLQIGASAEETIEVGISSMKASALGIKGLDISSNPDAANKAIDTIKAAIETVSSTRGDLGAIQNRLEHTINNLGVMEENIQDAEANIRDTDVADEMMAYTKNNILIQSAQAMLAQANQTPQGVLQLMQ